MTPSVHLTVSAAKMPPDFAGGVHRRPTSFQRTVAMMAIVWWPLGAMAEPGFGDWQTRAFATPPSTSLIELRQGSDLSRQVLASRGLGFETANGDAVNLSRWYSTRWTDVRVSWLTRLSPNTGLIWGFNSGERGEKYRISSGIKLGFVHQRQLGRNTHIALRTTTTLGYRLREKTCTADYGEIGGVQTVNCRLAATELSPHETLSYLFNESSRDQRQVSITFKHAF